jgi:hypothetical protein
VWRWRDSAGQWSKPLFDKAFTRNPRPPNPPIEQNCKKPAAFVIKYRDGLDAVAYMLDNYVDSWDFAAEVDGRIVATHFGQVPETRDLPHFDGLTDCIEQFFVSGKPLYPVERTLLTTGVLAFAFEAREKKSRVDTPQLSVAYRAPQNTYFQRS